MVRGNESNISPTIYLNDFFNQYEADRPFDLIMEQIADIRVRHEVTQDFDVSKVTDFDQVKDHIVPRLIGQENNEELLDKRPHTLVSDLAVTYHIELGSDGNGNMSVPITNDLMRSWNVTPEELHDIAISNMPDLAPSTFRTMNEVMAEMMMPEILADVGGDREAAEAFIESMMPPEGNMYVLSNEDKMNGATALLDEKVMAEISEKVGENYFILPSSIHETLIVPESAGMSLSDLETMVSEVNETQVAPQDRLSDHVYQYDANSKELYRADMAQEHFAEKENANIGKEDKSEKGRPSLKERLDEKKDVVKATPKKETPEITKDKNQSL